MSPHHKHHKSIWKKIPIALFLLAALAFGLWAVFGFLVDTPG